MAEDQHNAWGVLSIEAVLVTLEPSILQPISKAEARQVTVTSHTLLPGQDDEIAVWSPDL